MKRILLLSVIACALTAGPVFANPHSSSRSSPAHAQRSTITRATNFDRSRLTTTRNVTNTRNFNTSRNWNTSRNFNTTRNFNTARFANHHHRTRVVYVNYGYPWYGYGYGFGSSYYDYYPYPYGYGYGPSVNFNFNNDQYGSGYQSNGYDSNNNAQPAYRDGNYNSGNASMVSRVQEKLTRDGYYKGSIDGALGSRTHYAIRAYQRDHGLEANGTVTEELIRTMGLR
jgi:hypothetical protein